MTVAVSRDADGQRALLSGEPERAHAAFGEAAELYRQSWEVAPASAYGRLVGMLKSSVLAGGGVEEARYVRTALADADPKSPTASYARALAALILSDDQEAGVWALRMSAGTDAFARTGEAIAALSAHDGGRYAAAVSAIVRDFEQRAEHLTGVAIADTAVMLSVLAARRGIETSIQSPVLPAFAG
jgi:hypothetical protein